jgi:SpoVK/Ycf46/Vps4 family AAA+-type ATPase
MVKKSKVAPIMFFNEADAIFNRRMENAERSVDKGENALQNIILQEMETLDGILIATTNLQGNLDDAFERRFLYKLELDNPTTEVKARIWQSMMPDLKEDEARQLAGEFDFSGGQIENIVRKRFIDEVLGGGTVDIEGLRSLCRHEHLESKRRQNIGFMRHAG